MGIVSVGEILQGREGDRDQDANLGFTRCFAVITDSTSTGAAEVGNAVGVAHKSAYFSGSEFNQYALCTGLVPRQTNDFMWEVTATYTTNVAQVDEDPLQYDPVYSGTGSVKERVIDRDRDAHVIRNSAEDPYSDPAPVIEDSFHQFNIKINLPWNTYTPFFFCSVHNKINASQWGAFPAESLRSSVSYTSAFKMQGNPPSRVYYWETNWTFTYNPDTWDLTLLNAGFRELKDGKKRKIKDEDGNEVTSPWCLKTNGEKLAVGSQGNFKSYKVYPTYNYSSFPFPPPA